MTLEILKMASLASTCYEDVHILCTETIILLSIGIYSSAEKLMWYCFTSVGLKTAWSMFFELTDRRVQTCVGAMP